MVQEAPNIITPDAGHHSPPSRLLSKHRPRRRAAAPRATLPPPSPAPGQPDINLCHCCGVRFPPPPPGAKRRPVRPLRSLWRIVLLCTECLYLVRSAAVCSYCLSLDNLPPEDCSVTCRFCNRCVHHYCISGEHRTSLVQPIDVENFVCVDCCPTVKPGGKQGGVAPVHMLQAVAREPRKGEIVAEAKDNAVRKAMEVKLASNRVKEALAPAAAGGGSQRTAGCNPDLPDEELALQLHLAMNGSHRISRAGNTSGGDSAVQGKCHKTMVCGKKVYGDQELCVTNMMDQLDDVETGVEPLCRIGRPARRRLDPSVTIVLALECVVGKHVKESMKVKRKGHLGTKQENELVDRYMRKYSKRNSSKQTKNGNPQFKDTAGGKDKDGDGGNDLAPVK
ncbi:uncharacterized protein LOC102716222 [Oryza brachyantha]|uniref:Uncharacterized protein n=1 Tax=Oryza brachyantha TaxID=4533 RepID=J3ME13_ORYBR|nr:uncharacterized protein LOC102716222 [Oryza brachyantha]